MNKPWISGRSGDLERLVEHVAQPGPGEDRLDQDRARDRYRRGRSRSGSPQAAARWVRRACGAPPRRGGPWRGPSPGSRCPSRRAARTDHQQVLGIDHRHQGDHRAAPCAPRRRGSAPTRSRRDRRIPPAGKMPGIGPAPAANTDDQHQPEPERRHRPERQRDAGVDPVADAAVPPAGPDPQPQAEHRGDHRRGADQQDGRPRASPRSARRPTPILGTRRTCRGRSCASWPT